MSSIFSNQKSSKFSFQGKDLQDFKFQKIDIRGVNFSEAKLANANFSYAKAGLSQTWKTCLIFTLVMLSALIGLAIAFAGVAPGILFPRIESTIGIISAASAVSCIFIFIVLIIFRRGLRAELFLSIVVIIITLTILLALPGTDDVRGVVVLSSIAIAIGVAGAIGGAIAIAIAKILSSRNAWISINLTALIFSLIGMKAGIPSTYEFRQHLTAAISVIPIAAVLFWLSYHVGFQAVKDDSKYRLIRKIAISTSSHFSTSFRKADLTDADFTGSSLKYADFRGSTLNQTRWFQSKYLSQARIDGTYLENPKIRHLLVTLDGKDGEFDHLDLRGINLRGVNLEGASLEGAKLSEANLQDANLNGANLAKTQLYGTNLRGASITGAYIQDWSISADTNFEAVKCNYIYMQLPTKSDPDPCRKPDNRTEKFQPGDFGAFITPIITTISLYRTQNFDPRAHAESFRTLDLLHHGKVDPVAAASALKQLAERYPEANVEVAALEGRGDEKVRVQAKVSGAVDRSLLSKVYGELYKARKAMSAEERLRLIVGEEKDKSFQEVVNAFSTVSKRQQAFVQLNIHIGDKVSENNTVNINSGGGDVSGVVGSIKNVSGTVNLGSISGDVNQAIGQLPDTSKADEPSLRELLTQLKTAIESEPELLSEDKAEALEQVKVLAEAGQSPEDSALQKSAKTAMKVLKGTASGLPEVTKFVQECTKLLPAISALLILI